MATWDTPPDVSFVATTQRSSAYQNVPPAPGVTDPRWNISNAPLSRKLRPIKFTAFDITCPMPISTSPVVVPVATMIGFTTWPTDVGVVAVNNPDVASDKK